MLIKSIVFRSALCLILALFASSSIAETKNNSRPAPAAPASYLIGPGDVLNISVWKEEGMQKEVLVRPDGGITFPLAGEVQAGG